MSKILISFLLIFICSNSFAQENPLLGDWKVVAVDNGEVYFNSERDSVSLPDELKARHSDSAQLENLKKMVRLVYIDQIFTFSSDGQLHQNSQVMSLSSYYRIDPSSSTLRIYESNIEQEIPDYLILYKLKDDRLFLELSVTEPPTKFELKR